jgi:hypothetical protein
MDFTKFDSRAAAEVAGRLHLAHPATGELLYADEKREKPCIVLVRGSESRTVQTALRAVRNAKMSGAKKAETAQTLEDLHQAMVDGAKPLIAGFENVARGEAAATSADVDWFLNLQLINGREGEKAFVEQVIEFATDRSNYLGNASQS